MKRLIALPIVVFALIGLTQIAFAGSEPISGKEMKQVAPAPAPECNWTGFYIGANVGANWTSADYSSHFTEIAAGAIEDDSENVPADPNFPNPPSADDFTRNDEDRATLFSRSISGSSDVSFLGGGQLGYQHQFGKMVIGVEGDFDKSSDNENKARATSSSAFDIFDDPDTVDSVLTSRRITRVNWQGSVRGRLGYAIGCFLLYGTGGVAFADVENQAGDLVTSHVFDTFDGIVEEPGGAQIHGLSHREDDTLVGWTAGGGAEYALSNLVSLGIEYRHNDFGSDTFHKASDKYVSTGTTRLDLTGNQVTLRINILLGHLGLRK